MDQVNTDMTTIIRQAIAEFARSEQSRVEPAYKTELIEERRRREQLEHRVGSIVGACERRRRCEAENQCRGQAGEGMARRGGSDSHRRAA